MPRPKLPPGPGRPKGMQNKLTKTLKDMILGALHEAGGQKYLAEQAQQNPVAFMALVGKVLPMQVTGDGGKPFSAVVYLPHNGRDGIPT